MRRPLRSAFVLGMLVGLVVALLRTLGRDPRATPAPLAAPPAPLPSVTPPIRPTVPVEVTAPPEPEPEPELPFEPISAPAPEPDPDPVSAPAPDPVPVPDREPPAAVDGPEVVAAGSGEVPTWTAPVDGACPEGYPIKAKETSGIYHRPGGLSYERTRPDRCYVDEAAAEVDGFRAAKR